MDSSLDGYLYLRLPPPALDHAWLEFYRTRRDFEATGRPWVIENEMLRARNRLILHYAPIVKYVAYRKIAERRPEVPTTMFAQALLAVIDGMMTRKDGRLTDWNPTCVRLATEACDRYPVP